MFRSALAAWAAFWLGVVAAIIATVVVSWKIGLIVFAAGLLVTIVLVVIAARKGYKTVTSSDPFSDPFFKNV